LAGIVEASPADTPVTVVGGHSGATIVPLLSQSSYSKAITGDKYEKLVHRIQYGGDEVVIAKDGAGSATLSMAYAGAKFTNSLLRGLNGEKGVITPTFVKSPLFEDQGIDFFSSNVELGVSAFHYFSLFFWGSSSFFTCSLTVLKKSTLSASFLPKRRSSLMLVSQNLRRTSKKARISSHKLSSRIRVEIIPNIPRKTNYRFPRNV
jgi:malate/lactate dehydrogenase